MLTTRKLILFLFFVVSATFNSNAQAPAEESEQSVVTIIGTPVTTNQTPEFSQQHINTVNYQSQSTPPENGKLNNEEPKTIEPTLENGFHMRFEVESRVHMPSTSDRLGASSYTPSSGSSAKKKSKNSFTKFIFNTKKKFKCWFPKRQKKYKPNLCVDWK